MPGKLKKTMIDLDIRRLTVPLKTWKMFLQRYVEIAPRALKKRSFRRVQRYPWLYDFEFISEGRIVNIEYEENMYRLRESIREGRESIEDEPRSGRPSVSKAAENVVRVQDLVRSDRRLTVRIIGEKLNLNHTTVHQILTNELKMRNICAKMVPKNLSEITVSWPNHLKGHHFGTLENIQTPVTDQLKVIPISELHQCYEEWKKRLQHCVASEGSYFEGDNVEL
ncbi:HTH_48 domain-containing protein [Trichonephila clavipes]|nr:HTH_48 domain-containing protein [Trichonephila clavipes]